MSRMAAFPVGRTTLAVYFGRRFIFHLVAVFSGCLALIFFVDLVENLRRAGGHDVDFWTIFLLSLFRLPSISELVLPFAVLFAAMATFLLLTRSLELVVARAAGISAWQFIAPAALIAFIVGIGATALYNPLAAELRSRHQVLHANTFGGGSTSVFDSAGDEAWLRQTGADGPSILYARASTEQGLRLTNVTVWTFNEADDFIGRIDAGNAILHDGYWELNDAWVSGVDVKPAFHDTFMVSTYLTPAQVQENVAAADAVSFWALPRQIDRVERAGLSAVSYRLQYQTLLARPLLLSAMVIIAATVSLRVFRFGSVGRLVLAGIIAGFVLYVVSKLAVDLGNAGAIVPFAAAWGPALVATLIGTTIMLYQEDG